MNVQNVIAPDTGKDITKWINAAAQQHGFDAVGCLRALIAESGLRELAWREGPWPDVSGGLSQPAVKWLGPDAQGLTRDDDGTVQDTPDNRRIARGLCTDAAWLIQYTAPRYAALLQRWGDPLAAWSRWNKPNLDPSLNPNRAQYERGLKRAEEYRMTATVGAGIKAQMDAAGDEPITNEWTEHQGDAKVVKAWGKKGLYVASDDSGAWVNVGPFGAAET